VFASYPGIETASAGLNSEAENLVTAELVAWADIIFVMEKKHRSWLLLNFKALFKSVRVICLDIPDDYQFMDPELVRLLEARVPKFL
jgi:predicted protein tyrosine phosphatase